MTQAISEWARAGLMGELNPATLEVLRKYQRAANFLSVAQIYLKSNPLLREPLRKDDIKERLLGHWGTVPGINLIYAHLNRLILRTAADIILVTGPGHGAPAILANMYMEGTLSEYFPELTQDLAGVEKFVKWFSWPDMFPSHLVPAYPGIIHEGGELGYALATAYGAVLDNPDLICACIVGDGEAETGPTAGAWHSNKFINPVTDGAVLPVIHLNEFKIANPTILGSMTDDELVSLFTGYGYQVHIVDYRNERLDEDFDATLWMAYEHIRRIQQQCRSGDIIERPDWPLIILRSLKGMGGPKEVDGKPCEGSFHSHQVPCKDPKTNSSHFQIVESWMRSYKPEELFDESGRLAEDILAMCPAGSRRMSKNTHCFAGEIRKPLNLPSIRDFAIDVKVKGEPLVSPQMVLGKYLRKVIAMNQHNRNFRIFCPDELESNRLGAVLDVTDRQYTWPVPENSEHIARDGRVMEVLSEHNCQGWLQGYLLTGRHGIFSCYEAFLPIVDSMMNQYAKFLKSSLEVPWRKPVASLNYLLSSETWRQDHNGYSHQGPGFINNMLTKKGRTYRIYLPPDANTLISTVDHCLNSVDYINLVIAGKQHLPQFLNMDEAIEHCRHGASIWRWASTNGGEDPQILLCGCGDSVTLETIAAAQLLRGDAPEWRVRVTNVVRLTVLGIPEKYPSGMDEQKFQRIFPLDCPVIFNFHGYTAGIKQLVWERPGNRRFDINGYREEGTTTTPFDMHIRNRTSRYHIVMQTAQKMAARLPQVAAKAEEIIRKYEMKIRKHREYIRAEGNDPEEIRNWQWKMM